jgi:hypothetical protein
MLICRINARSPASICGRPPKDRDFQRQYRWQGTLFAAQFSAGYTTNISGFDLRQAHLFSFGLRWSFWEFSGAEGVFARRFPLLSETVGRRWSRSTVLTTEPGKTELCLSKGIPEPRHVAENRGLARRDSRMFDLNGEASTARTKQISAIIAPT